MEEYEYAQVTELLVWPENANIAEQPRESTRNLQNYLERGFEIYQAIPFSVKEVAGIKYILRKKLHE